MRITVRREATEIRIIPVRTFRTVQLGLPILAEGWDRVQEGVRLLPDREPRDYDHENAAHDVQALRHVGQESIAALP